MRAYIIDDEEHARVTMNYYLEEFFPDINVIGEAADIIQGGKEIARLKPDIVFLDISMPAGTGFELLDRIDGSESLFVFVSGHTEFFFDAIKINIFDYILKPVQLDELKRVITKARLALQDNDLAVPRLNGKIHIRAEGKTIVADCDEILFVSSEGNYSSIHFADGHKILITKNIKKLEQAMFSNFPFFRTHQSYLINLHKVKEFTTDMIKLDNGREVPLAKSRYELFRNAMTRI